MHQLPLTLSAAPALTPTQQIAFDRALVLLRASGVTFAVRLPDGTEHGTPAAFIPAPSVTPAPAKPKRKSPENNWVAETNYMAVLEAMAISDVRVFKLANPTRDRLGSFRGACSSRAFRLWGRDSAISTINHASGEVEIMRVA